MTITATREAGATAREDGTVAEKLSSLLKVHPGHPARQSQDLDSARSGLEAGVLGEFCLLPWTLGGGEAICAELSTGCQGSGFCQGWRCYYKLIPTVYPIPTKASGASARHQG